MSDDEADVLLQAKIDAALYARFAKQRERWGWSNKEAVERMLSEWLPELERSTGPPLKRSS